MSKPDEKNSLLLLMSELNYHVITKTEYTKTNKACEINHRLCLLWKKLDSILHLYHLLLQKDPLL